MRPSEAGSGPGETPHCDLCGRATFDPDKRSAPWARAVRQRHQVLVCPDCQRRPDWSEGLDRCPRCGGTRLSAMLGEVVCRACGTEVREHEEG